MQKNSGGTIHYWQQTQFQILVNLPKWYIQIFLGEDSGRSTHHSHLEIYWRSLEDTDDQNGKLSPPPFPLSSAYYHYFHSLLTAPASAPPPKHFNQQ